MPGRMQGNGHAVVRDLLAIRDGVEHDRPEPGAQDAFAWRCRQVATVAGSSMVGMCVRNHGARYRPPWIDVELSGDAVQAFPADYDEVTHAGADES